MQLRDLEMEKRDPRTVVAVVLGGGAGTRLFPLTRHRAKPAVSSLWRQCVKTSYKNCSGV